MWGPITAKGGGGIWVKIRTVYLMTELRRKFEAFRTKIRGFIAMCP